MLGEGRRRPWAENGADISEARAKMQRRAQRSAVGCTSLARSAYIPGRVTPQRASETGSFAWHERCKTPHRTPTRKGASMKSDAKPVAVTLMNHSVENPEQPMVKPSDQLDDEA